MELKVKEYQLPAPIEFNFDELKSEIAEKVKMYETLIYNDDQIKEAKADRANLNKLKKALNDERLRREREYMEPFNEFKARINEIISIIDKPIALIDNQVKEYEEKCREDKHAEIEAIFDGIASRPSWLTFNDVFEKSWLNASVSMSAISSELSAKLDKIDADVETIRSLPEFSFEALEVYKSTLDINRAISEGRRLADIQKRKEEQAKLDAERQAREAEEAAAKSKAAEEEIPAPADPESAETWTGDSKTWIGFKALMTVDQALELRNFFEAREIQFAPIEVME